MRPGQSSPGKPCFHIRTKRKISGFNEAGAIKPRKTLAGRLGGMAFYSFNEAGAIKPRKTDVQEKKPNIDIDSFNEAGAIKPRKTWINTQTTGYH